MREYAASSTFTWESLVMHGNEEYSSTYKPTRHGWFRRWRRGCMHCRSIFPALGWAINRMVLPLLLQEQDQGAGPDGAPEQAGPGRQPVAGAACSVHGGRRLGRSAPLSRSRPRRARRDKSQGTTCPNHVIDGSHRRSPATASPPLPSPWPLRPSGQAQPMLLESTAPFTARCKRWGTGHDRTGHPSSLSSSLGLTPCRHGWLPVYAAAWSWTQNTWMPCESFGHAYSCLLALDIVCLGEQCPSVFHFVESLWVYLDGEGRDDVSWVFIWLFPRVPYIIWNSFSWWMTWDLYNTQNHLTIS
jgi:hypothetical protein